MSEYHTSTYGYDWYVDSDGDIAVEAGYIEGDLHLSLDDLAEMIHELEGDE